jgi:hypothetical protein
LPSFANKRSLFRKIDSLPTDGPGWHYDSVKITGDIHGLDGKLLTEEVELWWRDPVDCVRELIGNPAFKDYMLYVPHREFFKLPGPQTNN